jgi:Uncharacterized conserved protein (COG2071)
MDVCSKLKHFALINYALPKSRLEPYIPQSHFDIPEFAIGGRQLALMSAVPFFDVDFHFIKAPFLKFSFGQTNFRVYVIDRKSGQHAVWFFGTTLGSYIVYFAKGAWGIPWYHARYQSEHDYDYQLNRYTSYKYTIDSKWCNAKVDLEDSGLPVSPVEGFATSDEMKLILTHPLDGYFYRSDNQVGKYSVWHEEIPFTAGRANNLYFSLYEDLRLLSKAEMQNPHSVFICPETEFKVLLPPRLYSSRKDKNPL